MKQKSDANNLLQGMAAIGFLGLFILLCFLGLSFVSEDILEQVMPNELNPRKKLTLVAVGIAAQSTLFGAIAKRMK